MKTYQYSLLGIMLFVLLWHAGALWLDKSMILPAPGEVFKALGLLLLKPTTLSAAVQTLWKVFLALFLVLVFGIALGLLLGLAKPLREMSRPIIMVIQAVPVISWLSIVIFSWGISWQGPVFIAVLSLIPTAILTTISGVQNLDKNLLEMARVYQVPRYKVIRYIYQGALFPFVVAIVDVCIGQAWKVILVSEFLVGDQGLGVQISWARQLFNVTGVYAYTLCAVLLGLITERLIKYSLGKVSRRWLAL